MNSPKFAELVRPSNRGSHQQSPAFGGAWTNRKTRSTCGDDDDASGGDDVRFASACQHRRPCPSWASSPPGRRPFELPPAVLPAFYVTAKVVVNAKAAAGPVR